MTPVIFYQHAFRQNIASGEYVPSDGGKCFVSAYEGEVPPAFPDWIRRLPCNDYEFILEAVITGHKNECCVQHHKEFLATLPHRLRVWAAEYNGKDYAEVVRRRLEQRESGERITAAEARELTAKSREVLELSVGAEPVPTSASTPCVGNLRPGVLGDLVYAERDGKTVKVTVPVPATGGAN